MYIVIKNWERFQHYRDRTPLWIKNYTELLSDEAYLGLSYHQRGVLHGLWMEYARARRQIPDSTLAITRRLGGRVTTRTLDALSHAGFIEYTLAPCYTDASLEVEESREEKKELRTSDVDVKAGLVLDSTSLPLSNLIQPVDNDNRFDPVLALLAVLPDSDAGTETILRNLRLPEFAYRNTAEQISEHPNAGVKLAIAILKRIKYDLEHPESSDVEDEAESNGSEHHPYDKPADPEATLRRLIANGAIHDTTDLEVELRSGEYAINETTETALRSLLPAPADDIPF